jgi:hypothetical protein
MQHDITKLCADSLRAFLSDNHGIKLKSGHAHEIVAAFFGYKSKISLLADETYPLAKLEQAEFILLNPPVSFVDQRIQSLEGLAPDFPPSYILAESIYSVITNDKALLEKIQPSFHDLALAFAKERLQQHIGHWRMNPAPQWIIDVETETMESAALFKISFDYPTADGKRSRYSKVDIKFPRVAGNIGYGMPEIMPTFYSGQFRDPDYNPDFGIRSGAAS